MTTGKHKKHWVVRISENKDGEGFSYWLDIADGDNGDDDNADTLALAKIFDQCNPFYIRGTVSNALLGTVGRLEQSRIEKFREKEVRKRYIKFLLKLNLGKGKGAAGPGTLIELEKKSQRIYRNKFNIRDMYKNLQYEIPDALGRVFGYGDPGRFGGTGGVCCIDSVANDFSHEEKGFMTRCIIEYFLDDEHQLMSLQNPTKYDAFLNDASFDSHLGFYNLDYQTMLEQLGILRGKLREIKIRGPKNYPAWVDKWDLCCSVDVGRRSKRFVAAKNKRIIHELSKSCLYIEIVIRYLIERCNEFTARCDADIRDAKTMGEA